MINLIIRSRSKSQSGFYFFKDQQLLPSPVSFHVDLL